MMSLVQHIQSLGGIQLSAAQYRSFQLYEQTLIEWNERANLTAIRSAEQIRIKHFLDSLTCLQAMSGSEVDRLVDVGSGAGFPGIPIKIACPEIKLTIIESVGKKADFCRRIVELLELRNVEILQERVEVIGQTPPHRQRYNWGVARAVAKMAVLAEYVLPLVRVGGFMLAMKGEGAPAETQAAEYSLRLLGGRLHRLLPVTLPGVAEERYLVVIEKFAGTPPEFPRRTGIPAKKPIQFKTM